MESWARTLFWIFLLAIVIALAGCGPVMKGTCKKSHYEVTGAWFPTGGVADGRITRAVREVCDEWSTDPMPESK